MRHEQREVDARGTESRSPTIRTPRACGALLAVTLMAGCATATSNLPAPRVTVPQGWQQPGDSTEVAVSESHDEDISRWWLQLDDTTLSDLVAKALISNPDLRSARARLHDTLAAPTPIPAAPERVVVGIPADTLRQRPDVSAAERRLAAETARLNQAKAARYPSFKLTGSLGVESLSLGGLTSGDTVIRSLLGSLTAPLFDRGRIRRQIEIQGESQEQTLAAYERTILTALEEVENALVTLANARRRQTALSAAAEAARNAAQLARSRYIAGLTSYQAVLDTERSVLSIEDGLVSTEAEGTSALIRLYKALGGGWAADTNEPKSEES